MVQVLERNNQENQTTKFLKAQQLDFEQQIEEIIN